MVYKTIRQHQGDYSSCMDFISLGTLHFDKIGWTCLFMQFHMLHQM